MTTIRDVLVLGGVDAGAPARLRVAADLAAAHQAHLTGLGVTPAPFQPPAYLQAQLPPGLAERQREWLDAETARAQALFDGEARRAGLRAEWRAVEGDLTATALLHARYADLAVVSQGLDLEDPTGQLSTLPADLVLGVGRPVLVVPRYAHLAAVGQRVLIAWDGSREATRAVNDALPLLRRAAAITVLSVDPAGPPARRLPGADISLHLARHGLAPGAAHTPAAGLDVGDALLSYAADAGADLLVMGAYGHSRLRERVLGGVTRHILQHMTLPVLLSH